MRILIPIVVLSLMLAGCEKRAVPQAESSATPPDSVRTDTAAVAAPTARPAQAPIIGRDSAFGPIGAIDDSGKLVPLPVRRP